MSGLSTDRKTTADNDPSMMRPSVCEKYEIENSTHCTELVSPNNAFDLIAMDIRQSVDKVAKKLSI